MTARNLLEFINSSPVNFLAVKNVAEKLDQAGFSKLDPTEKWELTKGGKYYVTKNSSAIFAFVVGTGEPSTGFRIISAHSDSPCMLIKPHEEML